MKADLESSYESALYLTFYFTYVQGLVLLMNASEKTNMKSIFTRYSMWEGRLHHPVSFTHVMDPMFTTTMYRVIR